MTSDDVAEPIIAAARAATERKLRAVLSWRVATTGIDKQTIVFAVPASVAWFSGISLLVERQGEFFRALAHELAVRLAAAQHFDAI